VATKVQAKLTSLRLKLKDTSLQYGLVLLCLILIQADILMCA
jgi:hypothetical protein